MSRIASNGVDALANCLPFHPELIDRLGMPILAQLDCCVGPDLIVCLHSLDHETDDLMQTVPEIREVGRSSGSSTAISTLHASHLHLKTREALS